MKEFRVDRFGEIPSNTIPANVLREIQKENPKAELIVTPTIRPTIKVSEGKVKLGAEVGIQVKGTF